MCNVTLSKPIRINILLLVREKWLVDCINCFRRSIYTYCYI